MIRTPWGDAAQLGIRKLRPGPGAPAEEVASNQRERIFAATVAVASEKGYEGTTVGDIVALAEVSRGSFYRHFGGKRQCFLATAEALASAAMAAVWRATAGEEGWEARLRAGHLALLELIAEYPAAACVWFVDLYAVDGAGGDLRDRAVTRVHQAVTASLDESPERSGLAPEIVSAGMGGTRRVVYRRLRTGRGNELPDHAPDLWRWLVSYQAPPIPLRRSRRPAEPAGATALFGPDQPGRLLGATIRAVAMRGYVQTTVEDVIRAAGTSRRMFYSHFESKEDAYLAALDAGHVQTMAACLPAFRRAPDWPYAIRDALEAMCAFLAREQHLAQAGLVEVHRAGAGALGQSDAHLRDYEELFAPAREWAPEMPEIAIEATVGAIDALLCEQVRRGHGALMRNSVPLLTYVALCPFVGPADAALVANDSAGHRRRGLMPDA